MTANESFDRRLVAWLESEAEGRVRDHLAEVLVTTRATRQRPGWASLERWLPMTSMTAMRPSVPRRVVPIMLVLALLAAGLASLVLLQVGRPQVPPFGRADNGRIVYLDGNSVRSVAADGSDPRTIATATQPNTPVVSPDGALVAYITGEDHLEIAPVVSGSGTAAPVTVVAPGTAAYYLPAWSPDGERVAFVAGDKVSDHVFVADRDGRNVQQLDRGAVEPGYGIGWIGFSPDGRWLAIADGIGEGPDGQLLLIELSGNAITKVATPPISFDDGSAMAWSPDPSTPRILYLSKTGMTRYYDLATQSDIAVASGFWPSWSPTGDRISYWSNGTKIIETPTATSGGGTPVEVFPSFRGNCGDHTELAGKALCGPLTWSPDGSRVVATEILGTGLLSLKSDGTGDPRFIDLQEAVNPGHGGNVSWQPILRDR